MSTAPPEKAQLMVSGILDSFETTLEPSCHCAQSRFRTTLFELTSANRDSTRLWILDWLDLNMSLLQKHGLQIGTIYNSDSKQKVTESNSGSLSGPTNNEDLNRNLEGPCSTTVHVADTNVTVGGSNNAQADVSELSFRKSQIPNGKPPTKSNPRKRTSGKNKQVANNQSKVAKISNGSNDQTGDICPLEV